MAQDEQCATRSTWRSKRIRKCMDTSRIANSRQENNIANSRKEIAQPTAGKKIAQGRLTAAIRPQGSSFRKGRSQDTARDPTRIRPSEGDYAMDETWIIKPLACEALQTLHGSTCGEALQHITERRPRLERDLDPSARDHGPESSEDSRDVTSAICQQAG